MSNNQDAAADAVPAALDTDVPTCRAFSLAVGGDVDVITKRGEARVLTLPAGVIPLQIKRINSAGTTATGLVLYYP